MKKTIHLLCIMALLSMGSVAFAQTQGTTPTLKPKPAEKRAHHKVHKGTAHKKKNKGHADQPLPGDPKK